jgi:hypothetical protein
MFTWQLTPSIFGKKRNRTQNAVEKWLVKYNWPIELILSMLQSTINSIGISAYINHIKTLVQSEILTEKSKGKLNLLEYVDKRFQD